jgi:hypothetical protein
MPGVARSRYGDVYHRLIKAGVHWVRCGDPDGVRRRALARDGPSALRARDVVQPQFLDRDADADGILKSPADPRRQR